MKTKLLLALSLAGLLMAGTNQKAVAQNPSDGLELYLPFNGNTKDASGNDRNGILEGAKLTTDRLGNPNEAYAFDSGANIMVPNFSSVGFKGVTIAAWIKTSKTSPQQQVVQGIVGVLYVNWIKTGHFMGAFDGTAGNNKSGDVSTSYVADGTWHHVASTNDGSKTRVFVDGNFESSYDEPLLTGVRDIQIGGGGWYFTGSMDDIRIYNYALQSTEIKAIHNGAKTSVMEDFASTGTLNIYPNPGNSSKQFNVEIPAAINNGSMTITTLPGRQVYTKSLKDLPKSSILPVDLKHFSSGIYMMNIISEKGISHAKFVIQ